MLKAEPRTIVCIWRDADGREHRERRIVHFERGFGPYVRWNRHTIPVGAMDAEVRLAIRGPARRNPGR